MLLALLTLPATAAAQEKMRAGDFRAMSPQAIADALLPAGHVPIARVTFDRMGEPRPPAPFVATIRSMRLFSTSVPISTDFCVQHEIVAEITPMPEADDALLDSPTAIAARDEGSATLSISVVRRSLRRHQASFHYRRGTSRGGARCVSRIDRRGAAGRDPLA